MPDCTNENLGKEVVGLLGSAYSGSTILCRLLGSHPAIFAAGETHWIEDSPWEQGFLCTDCQSSECRIFSQARRKRMIESPEFWWSELKQGVDEPVIISSDKEPGYFYRYGLPDRALVLFKEPIAWLRSAQVNDNIGVDEGLAALVSCYTNILSFIKSNSLPSMSVQLERLSTDPETELAKILEWLHLQWNDAVLSPHQMPCMIGGNYNARGINRPTEYLETFGDGVAVDERWRTFFSKGDAAYITSHPKVAEFRELLVEIERL